MVQWVEAKVLKTVEWTDKLRSLQIEAELGSFTAGQFTRLALTIDDERVARPYSYVNAPDAPHAEFYFNIVEEGPLSGRLAALKSGDRVEVAQPANGFFTLDDVPAGKHLWMLATGTALGPYLSILNTDKPWNTFEKLILVHAVRHANELSYYETIDNFSAQHPDQFSFIPFVSREQHEGALSGRIPSAIEDGRLEGVAELEINASDSQVMICGNLDMIRDTTEVLNKRGLVKNKRREPGQITTEKYW